LPDATTVLSEHPFQLSVRVSFARARAQVSSCSTPLISKIIILDWLQGANRGLRQFVYSLQLKLADEINNNALEKIMRGRRGQCFGGAARDRRNEIQEARPKWQRDSSSLGNHLSWSPRLSIRCLWRLIWVIAKYRIPRATPRSTPPAPAVCGSIEDGPKGKLSNAHTYQLRDRGRNRLRYTQRHCMANREPAVT
jgi:hypothetical protein